MVSLHKCADRECSYFGQAATRGCGCYKTDEQALREVNAYLLIAFERILEIPTQAWSIDTAKCIARKAIAKAAST